MSMKKFGVLLVSAAFVLAGCTTTDPYTGEQKTSNAAKGAGIGALAGAAIGALTNTSSGKQAARNAAIGAGIGILAGGAVGAYMDRQEQQLRQRLAGTGVGIRRHGDVIELVMPGNITFDTAQSSIRSGFFETLNSVAIVLDEFDKTLVDVMGHTDSDGSEQYNLDLSYARADSVSRYLISQQVAAQRLVVQGFGERTPIASNTTAAGKQQNRRVEIQISPLTTS
jgi:outer membrane protein OmpA-like peptidoglycan-associated protein